MEAHAKTYWRGLLELEIAVVKRMRLWGLPRDYILSFLIEPGRALTPACISEIENGQIGADVEPATESVVRLFVNERLNAIRPLDVSRFDEPISPWRIQQALLWARTKQTTLFHEEGYETEFKIIFEDGVEKIAKYMKTMSSFANHSGGYIFFGINDAGEPVKFNPDRFLNHDWDAFDKLLETRFQPYLRWHKTIVDVPVRAEFRFDAELIKREAKARGVSKDRFEWMLESDPKNLTTQIGVIYSYSSDQKIRCVKSVPRALKADTMYIRRKGRNGRFEEYEMPLGSAAPPPPALQILANAKIDEFERAVARSSAAKADDQQELL